MDRELLIKLTKELYRLTLLFPKKEPLRYKVREVADEILAQIMRVGFESDPAESGLPRILEDLEVLNSFFEVAKSQNWASPIEILRVQEEYDRLRAEIKKIPKRTREIEIEKMVEAAEVNPRQQPTPGVGMNERQKKILAFLRENGRAQVWQVKEILSEVSKRTLRRDFNDLLKNGLIDRVGERNDTFYQIKKTEQI